MLDGRREFRQRFFHRLLRRDAHVLPAIEVRRITLCLDGFRKMAQGAVLPQFAEGRLPFFATPHLAVVVRATVDKFMPGHPGDALLPCQHGDAVHLEGTDGVGVDNQGAVGGKVCAFLRHGPPVRQGIG